MRRFVLLLPLSLALAIPATCASKPLGAPTAASGLREALSLGTGKAVDVLGVKDGFNRNDLVRIELPEKLTAFGKVLRSIGQGALVDDFELSMNRAAEAAVPVARSVFLDTVKEMTFEDALKILGGSEHSATDYLREHAGPRLVEQFRPIVAQQLDTVGATRSFDAMMSQTAALPLSHALPSFELDKFVTGKALDGLFVMVAREEKNIRTNVADRATPLLAQVFGSKEAKKALGGSQPSKPKASPKDRLQSLTDALQKK